MQFGQHKYIMHIFTRKRQTLCHVSVTVIFIYFELIKMTDGHWKCMGLERQSKNYKLFPNLLLSSVIIHTN